MWQRWKGGAHLNSHARPRVGGVAVELQQHMYTVTVVQMCWYLTLQKTSVFPIYSETEEE